MNDIDIHPADRVASVREYYLQRKMREVAQLNAAGADIISLGIGGPDMPPHKRPLTHYVPKHDAPTHTDTN